MMLLAAILLCGTFCGQRRSAADETSGVLIRGVPHAAGPVDFSGETCLAMLAEAMGAEKKPQSKLDPAGIHSTKGQSHYVSQVQTALAKLGFKVGPGRHAVASATDDEQLQRQFTVLLDDLKSGVPSLVAVRRSEAADSPLHFRLVLGYDNGRDELIYHEPAEADGAFRRMKRGDVLARWAAEDAGGKWSVVRLPLASDRFVIRRPGGPSEEDFARHVAQLRKNLPADFHVVVQKPFVVIGNELAGTVRRRAREKVAWASAGLKQLYFEKDPGYIINIWIFKDKKSYLHHVKQMFGETPPTQFGYYSGKHRAMFMNISTGDGTLVHEMVHAFMHAHFPKCPTWFNEGLASLYEQCNERQGQMKAQTNQRLRMLHQAIQKKQLPPFELLCQKTGKDFYHGKNLLNYAQARYICYYLEKQGLLQQFYRQFRENAADDPTGYETLKQILETDDMPAFQRKWEYYILTLRY